MAITEAEWRALQGAEDEARRVIQEATIRKGERWIARAIAKVEELGLEPLREPQPDSAADLVRALATMPEWMFREDHQIPANPAGEALREMLVRMIDRVRSLLVSP